MICAYYTTEELARFFISDKDVKELLEEVNSKTGNKFYLQETKGVRKRFLKKDLPYSYYSLYKRVTDDDLKNSVIEVQCINFCQDHDWSINTNVTKSYIVTLFLGILEGLNYAKHE